MKVGIMACGGIAGSMAKTLNGIISEGNKDIIAYAVASRNIEKAKAFAEEYGIEKAYGSYEELVKDSEVDLVYIATPHSHHCENIKLCLENGKHVLCEKAFTQNKKQAEEVISLAKEKGLLLAEAMWVRYMPLVKTLTEVINSGVIGDITTVTSNLHYSIDMNQRIVDPNLAGGALLDVGVYALTFASICLGENICDMSATCIKFDTGVDRQNSITLIYPDGKMAVCNSGAQAISDRKGIIYGRKGYIIVENINNPESITVYNAEREVIGSYRAPKQITGYEYQVYACKEAIEKGLSECPDCPHDKTLAIMGLMDMAREKMGVIYPNER